MIQLFDIKTRTLGFAFCQPQKKSLPKSLTPKKSLQNLNPKKVLRSQISNPKKGFAHLRHLRNIIAIKSTYSGSNRFKGREREQGSCRKVYQPTVSHYHNSCILESGIEQMPNYWSTSCDHFSNIKGYYRNAISS